MLNLVCKVLCVSAPPARLRCSLGPGLSPLSKLQSRTLLFPAGRELSLSGTEPPCISLFRRQLRLLTSLPFSLLLSTPLLALVTYSLGDICFPTSSRRAGTSSIVLTIIYPVPHSASDPLHELLKCLLGE